MIITIIWLYIALSRTPKIGSTQGLGLRFYCKAALAFVAVVLRVVCVANSVDVEVQPSQLRACIRVKGLLSFPDYGTLNINPKILQSIL